MSSGGRQAPVLHRERASQGHPPRASRAPPADSKVTKFDVRWVAKGLGCSQVIAKDVSFDWSTAVGSRPEDGLRMVQVAGAGLPKPKQIYPVPAGSGRFIATRDLVQS